MSLAVKAYVVQGRGVFHASLSCPDLVRQQQEGVAWCSGRSAHFSRLRPCAGCCDGLMTVLKRAFGSLASGEKASRGLPDLRTLSPAAVEGDGEVGSALPYGPVTELDDPRFSNVSAAGWGTRSFGQHPEEFLGSATEDDNDWRGGGRRE